MRSVTALDFHQGPGRAAGLRTMEQIVEDEYGSFENFYQCEFVVKGELCAAYSQAKTPADRWRAIRNYYAFVNPLILREDHRQWATFDDLPLDSYFTPIESDAWQCCRLYGVVVYPQYPVLNCFVDFANPKIKLAIELDGKAFHDPAKDAARDQRLMDIGWTVYRIPGARCHAKRLTPSDIRDQYEEGSPEFEQAFRAWYCETSEGVICAIWHQYFAYDSEDDEQNDHPRSGLIRESLRLHRSRGLRGF